MWSNWKTWEKGWKITEWNGWKGNQITERNSDAWKRKEKQTTVGVRFMF